MFALVESLRPRGVRGLEVVAFATNSARRLTLPVADEGLRCRYHAQSWKPFRTKRFLDPQPGLVVGDQIATDGVLACPGRGWSMAARDLPPSTDVPASRPRSFRWSVGCPGR
ncbi:hypothetical protein Rhe02_50100 [Rhizocola hellebori]|uniref:Uncharacterized protein n=1 Tax=Rhizocola hellebori TaxID=1392758 RepID=A0A8J3VIH5_9ACTN|nr:hypothetical protein Rhe02_50100 [Rhizocola hellebori]